MKNCARMGVCASLVLAAAAFAQPTLTADAGALATGVPATGTITGFTAGQVKWLGFELPAGVNRTAGDYLDIDTNGGTLTGGDSHIGLFSASGAFIASNDDSGPSAYSMLSFGATTPTRPGLAATGNATTAGATHAGGSGATLAAGKYYLAITGFGGNTYAANWTVGTTHTRTGDVAYRLAYFTNTQPTNPSGAGSFAPTAATNCGDSAVLASVLVTAGGNPTSTGVTVTANLSSIGGSASQVMFDNGTNGDVTAGDGRYSFGLLVSSGTAVGNATFAFSIADAQGRSATGTSGNLAVSLCPPPRPVNDNCAGAIPLAVGTPLAGYFTSRSPAVNPGTCGPITSARSTAWYTFTGTGNTMTVGTDSLNTNFDSIIGVYCISNGCAAATCIGGDDDSGTGTTSLFTFCSDAGAQYAVVVAAFSGTLATGTFDVLATDSGTPCNTAIPCAPKGACCLPSNSSCTQLTAAACEDQGGTFQGVGSLCASVSFGEPNVSADTFPVAIPDFANTVPGSASTTVTVSTAGFNVEAINVCVGLTHTFAGDVIATLSNGVHSARLINAQGGASDLGGTYCFSSNSAV
ncbi:MAG: hypothetical protein NTV94_08130, partial [Planctomycetota bacterium]|nr:hypothetical protein [Planctomycetota bacterium]